MAKRRRKIKRSSPPWKSAIGVAALAHLVLIAGIIALTWQHFANVHAGNTVFVHDVVEGSDEGGGAAITNSSRPTQTQGRNPGGVRPNTGETQVHTPSPRPSPEGEGGSNLAIGNLSGTTTGSSSVSGNGAGTGPSGAGDPTLAEIRRRIESAKRYPAQARSMHQEGRVGVHFKILPNGQVAEIHVSHSSGISTLDDAAVQAVQRSTPLPTYSNAIDLSLAFRLR